MNDFGLPQHTIEQIKSCFINYPDIKWVKIYGSRAMNTYEFGSDVDLAFSSSSDYSTEIASCLENLPTPYLFDVTHYETIQNENLKKHIDKVGKILFTQPPGN
jgi:predicted nucleotidyltransferase